MHAIQQVRLLTDGLDTQWHNQTAASYSYITILSRTTTIGFGVG